MTTAMIVFATIACLFHLMAFVMESLLFMRPAVYKRFNAKTRQEAEATRLFAFNQGFYNLFLVAGCVGGMLMWQAGAYVEGGTLVLFTCACMVGAGCVLFYSSPRMWRVALYQAVPPGIVVGLYFL